MPKWTKEQQEAIDLKGTNIIVSAGAGSGKTAVLSERVLKHVQEGIHINEMLILTFTKAAAAEMKERIRTKLLNDENLKEEAIMVDTSDITTFDAFSLSIVQKYGYLFGIPSTISIIDSSLSKIKSKNILESIFDEYYKKENPKFIKLISDFCLKDDKEIKEAILKINEKLDNLVNKREYLENYNATFKSQIKKYIKDYENLIKEKINQIKSLIDYLKTYVDGTYIEKLLETLNPLLNSKDYDEIKLNIPNKIPSLPRGSEEEAKTLKKEITQIKNEIEKLCEYQDKNEIEESLQSTLEYTEIICEIILNLDKQIMEYKNINNTYDFIDIAKIAINILKQNENIKNEMKEKYKEILIDEYQDTNDIQDIFISLFANNNVYMVGDIKQSIYRFRNANPLLFKNKYDTYSANKGGKKIDLNKNFRSRKEVAENINTIFNLIMDNQIGGADYLTSHQMVFGNTAYNNVNNENYDMEILNYEKEKDFPYSEKEIEIFTIANDIKEKIKNHYKIMDKETLKERDVNYKDFVILIDRSTSFEDYKKVFEYLNIPLTIYRDKKINDSDDMVLIKHIYNLIFKIKENTLDIDFKYSLTSLMRSYLFSMNDDIIFKIISQNNYKETPVYNLCLEISKNIDNINNYELCNQIIEKFNFYEKIVLVGNINEHITVLDAIINISKTLNDMGYDAKDFLTYLNSTYDQELDIKLSTNKENSNSVKIMTIHTSKGLEYGICYFSGFTKTFNLSDIKEKFTYTEKYGIITPYLKEGPKTTILKTLLKENYKKEEISEKLRLFYVALTRAREKMIIITSLKPNPLSFKENGVINTLARGKYNSFNDIMNTVQDYITPYIKEINLEKIGLTKDYNLTKKAGLNTLKETATRLEINEYNFQNKIITSTRFSKTTNNLYTKEEQKNIEFGKKMHNILELIEFENPDYSTLNNFEKNIIEKFINTNILKGNINLYKEYEFIYKEENKDMHGFIDLLIEYPNKYAIIDYKLKNTKDKEYYNQVNGYRKYLQSITTKKIEIYLYSLIDGVLVDLDKVTF